MFYCLFFRWFFTLYYGKSPFNHHWGIFFYSFQASKSGKPQFWGLVLRFIESGCVEHCNEIDLFPACFLPFCKKKHLEIGSKNSGAFFFRKCWPFCRGLRQRSLLVAFWTSLPLGLKITVSSTFSEVWNVFTVDMHIPGSSSYVNVLPFGRFFLVKKKGVFSGFSGGG